MIVPFFGIGQQGKSRTVTAQRHLNLYAEFQKDQDKSQIAFFGTPGLTLEATIGDNPIRGWIAVGNVYYVVQRGLFYEVNSSGVATFRGTLDTISGRVDMAYNGTLILITTGTSGYTHTLSSNTFAIISDSDFPDAAITCTWLDGNFIVDQGSGDEFQISPSGTAWDALDFATAESNPDGLVRVFADNGELVLFGQKTVEFWGNIGASDFPFAPIKGATQEFGLIARWSVCQFNSGLAALMTNAGGEAQVVFIQGYVPRVLSSQEIDSIINRYTTLSDASFYAYNLGGHPMLQCNFPTEGKSWLYDASTQMWSPLEYGMAGARHRGEMQLNFQNKSLIADYEFGLVYNLAPDTYTDNGTAIAREIVSRHLFNGNKRERIDQLYVDMQVGVGLTSGQGSDPQVMLQISKNNGATWGTELWKGIGAIGNYLQRIVWRRLGIARDWTFKLRVTDPVKVVFIFGDLGRD